MAEFISREAAIRVVNGQSSLTMTRSSLIDSISNIPAADVAPVVRCKGCKHLVAVNVNGKGIPTCRVSGMEVAPDEFCSRGEKGRRCR